MIRGLLCLAASGAILLAQESPTTRTIHLPLTEGSSLAAAASHDRRWIAMDLVDAIWVLPMSGGDARRLTPGDLRARNPTWSADDESIAFEGFGDVSRERRLGSALPFRERDG